MIARWLLLIPWLIAADAAFAASQPMRDINIDIQPCWGSESLVLDREQGADAAGAKLSVSRLDFLLSNIALRREDGSWLESKDWFACIRADQRKHLALLEGVPGTKFTAIRFNVGLDAVTNASDPNTRAADHPLHPLVNGLHWGWAGSYIFLAMEGRWQKADGSFSGWSYHIANNWSLMQVELPVELGETGVGTIRIAFDLAKVFRSIDIAKHGDSTHSREGDTLAVRLKKNIEQAFRLKSVSSDRYHDLAQAAKSGADLQSVATVSGAGKPNNSPSPQPSPQGRGRRERSAPLSKEHEAALDDSSHEVTGLLSPAARQRHQLPLPAGEGWGEGDDLPSRERSRSPEATPFPLEITTRFPKPSIPADNVPSIEGVALGEKLFHDQRLSKTNTQSCASCHDRSAAFADPNKRFSIGAEGQIGKRNAMPLFNLLWQQDFFWDGRAVGLRHQALMPIQDAHEMNESLDRVVAKLSADDSIREQFARVFANAAEDRSPDLSTAIRSPDLITPERIGLALEQYLHTLISQDSKFDRALRKETTLTPSEARGLQLFVTEHDPKRGLRGADCFHCHGGMLVTDRAFHNNGLPLAAGDIGREAVTKNAADRGKFKTPSLRNIALTAPYMHDGRFASLEEVIEHYDHGVVRSDTLDPNLAKHPTEGLGLTAQEKADLAAFLRTLTDAAFTTPKTSLTQSNPR